MKICFATNNPNKLKEIKSLLSSEFEIIDLKSIGCTEEILETHETIEENSLEKAEYVFKNYNVPCFADDSGLEVEALDGAPGVYSAMYAGPQRSHKDNVDRLLKELKGKENRSARFKSVITYIDKNGHHAFEGISTGKIAEEPNGSGGFGYDPIFIPEGETRTNAEMNLEEKNHMSSRARAFKKFVSFLSEYSLNE
ncbi:MAG: RdgB/HAM1 family non-canonical purine NTP pyrophosphatase [Bacteroidota bacterium]